MNVVIEAAKNRIGAGRRSVAGVAARPDGYLLLTLSLTLFALAPLLYPGYFEVHSGFGPIWNVSDLRQRLADPGWLPGAAGAFDPWRGEGLLPYYLAALWPVGPVAAVKSVMGLGLLLGASGLYVWLRGWLGRQGATLAALVYTYLPFTLATLYVRGAWAETLFWGLAPWALLAATRRAESSGPGWLPLVAAALVWAGLGLTQLGLSLWLLVWLLLWLIVLRRRRMGWPLLAAALGLGGALALTLSRSPAANPAGEVERFTGHLVYPAQLFSAFWGFGVSRPGWDDGLSLSLGLAATGLAIVAVAIWWGDRDRRPAFFLATLLALLALMTPLGGVAWRLPGLAATLTFPWQLLGLAGLCLAVLAGVGPWLDARLRAWPAFAVLLVFALLASYPQLEPRFSQREPGTGPQAVLGDHQIVVLAHHLAVETSGGITGLDRTRAGLDLADYGPPRPGDTLVLQVDWQALQPQSEDFKVFVHLVDGQGNVLAQVDAPPQAGEAPTSGWIPGQVVADTYRLTLPVDAPPGPHRLYLGLYRGETLERLPVAGDDQGRVIIEVGP